MAEFIATICAGLWSGGCIYLSLVQHPAAHRAGPDIAAALVRPMSARAAPMFIVFAFVGTVAGVYAWFQGAGSNWLIGAMFLGAMFPFTAILIVPTNRRLLKIKPGEVGGSEELFTRWGRLHGLRALLGSTAFLVFVSVLTLD
jgi:hypothetical protein